MWSLYLIQSRGVRPGDPSESNALVCLDEKDRSPRIIFIDFAFADTCMTQKGFSLKNDANQ